MGGVPGVLSTLSLVFTAAVKGEVLHVLLQVTLPEVEASKTCIFIDGETEVWAEKAGI